MKRAARVRREYTGVGAAVSTLFSACAVPFQPQHGAIDDGMSIFERSYARSAALHAHPLARTACMSPLAWLDYMRS